MQRPLSMLAQYLAIFLILLSPLFLCSQDLHFTNYTASPQNLNPALTGNFSGTFKIGGIYRDQFSRFFSNGYQSQGGFIEYNLPLKVGGQNWLAAGAFLDNDVSGDLAFGSARMGMNLAYHLQLNKKNTFTLGLQGAFINRKTDNQGFRTEETLLASSGIENVASLLDNYNARQFDFSAGILYSTQINRTTSSKFGLSIYHLTGSSISSGSNAQDYIPLRINAHGEMSFGLANNFTLTPRIYFTSSEEAKELAAQLLLGIPFAKNNLELGIGHRFQDAIQFILGFDLRGWVIQGSFDLTVSSASAYNDNIGGFEIGAYKIITTYPKTKIKNLLICPRL